MRIAHVPVAARAAPRSMFCGLGFTLPGPVSKRPVEVVQCGLAVEWELLACAGAAVALKAVSVRRYSGTGPGLQQTAIVALPLEYTDAIAAVLGVEAHLTQTEAIEPCLDVVGRVDIETAAELALGDEFNTSASEPGFIHESQYGDASMAPAYTKFVDAERLFSCSYCLDYRLLGGHCDAEGGHRLMTCDTGQHLGSRHPWLFD